MFRAKTLIQENCQIRGSTEKKGMKTERQRQRLLWQGRREVPLKQRQSLIKYQVTVIELVMILLLGNA